MSVRRSDAKRKKRARREEEETVDGEKFRRNWPTSGERGTHGMVLISPTRG